MILILLIAGVSLVSAQFPPAYEIPGVPQPPWQGPIADHVIGQQPKDTPEVADAKARHLKAVRETLAILPELPPEERYKTSGIPSQVNQFVPAVQPFQPVVPMVHTLHHMQNHHQVEQEVSAQFPPAYDIPGVPPPPWQGPIADHVIGQQPRDTPEVAAAKARHLKAVRETLTVLPELPPEERYKTSSIPSQVNQFVPAVQPFQPVVPMVHTLHHVQSYHQVEQPVHHHHVQQPVQPAVFDNTPVEQVREITVFAEEIPRSPIGEVPEVHAARVSHLKAHTDARASLPVVVQ